MPFVPVLQGGGDEDIIRRAVQALQADTSLNELESLLAFFASFVLDTELVAQILRWDMVVLRESPWYQEILQEGELKGELKGEQVIILKLLTRKLGVLSPKLRSQIESLSLPQLEALGESLLEFSSPDDLAAWMQHSASAL